MRLARAALLAIVSLAGCRARSCDRGKGIVADDATAQHADDLVEACVQEMRARCLLLDRCEPGTAKWWGGLDRCAEQSRRSCRAAVGAPGVTVTVASYRTCIAAYATQSCDDDHETPSVCDQKGTLPCDAPCVFPMQCASGACRIEAQKTCGRCVEKSTRKKGDSCTFSVNDTCEHGTACIFGTCKVPHDVGEDCATILDCRRPLRCAAGKCTPYAKAGESCSFLLGTECGPTSKCVSDVCVPRDPPKPPGAPCDDLLDCIDFTCIDHTCREVGEEGARCGELGVEPPCAAGLACVDERCTAYDPAKCK